jgi:hypothetical protein
MMAKSAVAPSASHQGVLHAVVGHESRCQAQCERQRIPKWHHRAESARQRLCGPNVHRVFQTTDAGVKEHGHGNFIAGHRPRDHDRGDFKSVSDVRIHNLALNISAVSPECKLGRLKAESKGDIESKGGCRQRTSHWHLAFDSHRSRIMLLAVQELDQGSHIFL